ncbi:MAG: CDP-diacylglycerol--glycerol-3-phosphate 3-phosphatidyltransferase [Alphaproteobacteria bacterium]|nr:CDP-diacylglycerol--glycerol-3-phosphate 3-phosphatidyltransferase [Alphaproteobacteria bacterium]
MAKLKNMMKSLPNILTLSRILCAPLLFYLIVESYHHNHDNTVWTWIVLIMLYSFITDYFDGWLARKLNATSHFGAMLDPVADKIVVIVMLISVSILDVFGPAGYVAVLVIIIREFIVSGAREYSGAYQIKLPVTRLAKLKTVLQMAALFIIFVEQRLQIIPNVKFGEFLLICAAIMSLITGVQYFRKTVIALNNIKQAG